MSRPSITLCVEPESDGQYRANCRVSATIAPTIPTSSITRSNSAEQIGDALRTIARVRPKM